MRSLSRPQRRLAGLVCPLMAALGLFLSQLAVPAYGALPVTSSPELTLERTIQTSPFPGATTSTKDNEGSAYVPRDHSLWIVDDDGRSIHEVDPTTGAHKRTIGKNAFESARQYGSGPVAGKDRYRDLESAAYDPVTDTLLVFSGSCCTTTVLPTVFRLQREANGALQIESYQPLPAGTDYTAAAWAPADGKIYVAVGRDLRSYDYATNTAGPTFQVSGLSGMLGMSFSPDGADLFVVRSGVRMSRVDWSTKTMVDGWTFDLTGFGMLDARAVEIIADKFYISDGYDYRDVGDPLRHAVLVFDVGEPGLAPTASFTASTLSGSAPLSVEFTDTTTGAATGWAWDFGDGATSTERHPTHVYESEGEYSVTLTASNSSGQSSVTERITVGAAPPPPPGNLVGNSGFEADTAGWDNAGISGVSLERVAGGRSGSWSAKLTNVGAGTLTNTINDAPNWVQTTSGGTYTAGMWVRSDTPGAKLYLRIREVQGKTKLGETLVPVTLTTGWQEVSGSFTVAAPGSSTLDLAAAVYSAPAGSNFYIDDITLTLG